MKFGGKTFARTRKYRAPAIILAAILDLTVSSFASAQMVARSLDTAALSPTRNLTQALQAINLTTCASTVLRVADFLFEDGDANFTVQPLGPDANAWPTVITIESRHAANGRTRLSTVTVSPNCAGFYQQVIHWPVSCDQLKSTTFAKFTNNRVLLDAVKVSELGAAVQLYLMPAGAAGCVSTKKELFR